MAQLARTLGYLRAFWGDGNCSGCAQYAILWICFLGETTSVTPASIPKASPVINWQASTFGGLYLLSVGRSPCTGNSSAKMRRADFQVDISARSDWKVRDTQWIDGRIAGLPKGQQPVVISASPMSYSIARTITASTRPGIATVVDRSVTEQTTTRE